MADRELRPGGFVLGLPLRLLLSVAVVLANFGGAAVVFVLAAWVVPDGRVADPAQVRLVNIGVFLAYLVVVTPVGLLVGRALFRLRGRGARVDPAGRARRLVLYGPLRLVVVLAVLWAGAVVLFGLL